MRRPRNYEISLLISNTTMKLISYENSFKFKGLQYQLRFDVLRSSKEWNYCCPRYELLHEV